MGEVLVIGHRNPDTDAVCSAIAYAEFKRRTGLAEATAARCGDTNERTDFVLRTFGVAPPRFVADVSPKVRDVMQTQVVTVPSRATVAEALSLMDERNIRVLPMLDEARRCTGLLSIFKMGQHFFPSPNRPFDSRRVLASIRNLAACLQAQTLHAVRAESEEELILMIGAMSLESFAGRLARFPADKLAVVLGDRQDLQEFAVAQGVRVLIVTGGLAVAEAILAAARARGVSLLRSPHDSVTTAMLARAAVTVAHMVHRQFLTFREDDALASARQRAIGSNFQAFPVVDEQGRLAGILSKSDFLKKVDRRLILVDHNELSQAVPGADQVEILEVVDHHRIAFHTTQPIHFRNEPVGSTSTIVADCFFREGVELPPPIAGLLLAGVVSDTLNLTSPTTTARDVEVLRRLETLAGVNAGEFTDRLFASGSVLTSKPAAQAIAADCKEYVEGEHRFSVAQIEELGFTQFWKRKDEVFAALEAHRRGHGYRFAALLVTDVVQQTSLLLVAGDAALHKLIDYPQVAEGVYELPGVVSRKKQLLPFLAHCLRRQETGSEPSSGSTSFAASH